MSLSAIISKIDTFMSELEAMRDELTLKEIDYNDHSVLEAVISAVYSETGVRLRDLQSQSRKRSLVEARIITTNYLMSQMKFSNAQLCKLLHVTHTTIIYYLDQYEILQLDASFRIKSENLNQLITESIKESK